MAGAVEDVDVDKVAGQQHAAAQDVFFPARAVNVRRLERDQRERTFIVDPHPAVPPVLGVNGRDGHKAKGKSRCQVQDCFLAGYRAENLARRGFHDVSPLEG